MRGLESWAGCAFATWSHNALWGLRWPLWLGNERVASVASWGIEVSWLAPAGWLWRKIGTVFLTSSVYGMLSSEDGTR